MRSLSTSFGMKYLKSEIPDGTKGKILQTGENWNSGGKKPKPGELTAVNRLLKSVQGSKCFPCPRPPYKITNQCFQPCETFWFQEKLVFMGLTGSEKQNVPDHLCKQQRLHISQQIEGFLPVLPFQTSISQPSSAHPRTSASFTVCFLKPGDLNYNEACKMQKHLRCTL